MRADKWLWQARFFKSRAMATRLIAGGHLRVNSEKIARPARPVGPGDTLTFPQGREVRVVRIVALGTRRGPAPEAQALYDDLAPERGETVRDTQPGAGNARPTKKARRSYDLWRGRSLE